jgi:signal transduction histidine kinase
MGDGTHAKATIDAAVDFRAEIPDLVDAYHARLRDIESPIASNPKAWEQCASQARFILQDCASSLAGGVCVITDSHIAATVDLGNERVRQGVHITHSIRAGVILFDLALSALLQRSTRGPASPDSRVAAAVRSLQLGVGRRLEAGSIGYDSFLLSRMQEIYREDHRRLARELHDEIGNSLSLVMRQLELYEVALSRDGEPLPGRLAQAKQAVVETLGRTRELVTELRKPTVTGTLEAALRAFVTSMGEDTPNVQIWTRGTDQWLPDQLSEEIFIMVRECLRNAFAHAGAGNIGVQIDVAPREIELSVIDDGCGFDLDAVRARGRTNGLLSLQERVDLLQGTLRISSTPCRGTHVTFWIPFHSDKAQGSMRWATGQVAR